MARECASRRRGCCLTTRRARCVLSVACEQSKPHAAPGSGSGDPFRPCALVCGVPAGRDPPHRPQADGWRTGRGTESLSESLPSAPLGCSPSSDVNRKQETPVPVFHCSTTYHMYHIPRGTYTFLLSTLFYTFRRSGTSGTSGTEPSPQRLTRTVSVPDVPLRGPKPPHLPTSVVDSVQSRESGAQSREFVRQTSVQRVPTCRFWAMWGDPLPTSRKSGLVEPGCYRCRQVQPFRSVSITLPRACSSTLIRRSPRFRPYTSSMACRSSWRRVSRRTSGSKPSRRRITGLGYPPYRPSTPSPRTWGDASSTGMSVAPTLSVVRSRSVS